MDGDSGDKRDSDSDELDHRYYLWSDYDLYFILTTFFRSGIPVLCKKKKKYNTY